MVVSASPIQIIDPARGVSPRGCLRTDECQLSQNVCLQSARILISCPPIKQLFLQSDSSLSAPPISSGSASTIDYFVLSASSTTVAASQSTTADSAPATYTQNIRGAEVVPVAAAPLTSGAETFVGQAWTGTLFALSAIVGVVVLT